jgi:sortase family protein
VVAGVLLVAAGVCVPLGLQVHRHPLAPPVASPIFRPVPVAQGVVAPVVAHSVPVSLRIPAIALSVSLSALGLTDVGSVQVPTDIQQPGWFDLGPTPGQLGSAVILGHVDSYQGEGIFFNLRELQGGDRVHVSLADGAVATFVVTSVVQYAKAQFPAQEVYRSHGTSALQLVTCGGTFDTQTGHYLSNVVVYSSLVSVTAPTATHLVRSTPTPEGSVSRNIGITTIRRPR